MRRAFVVVLSLLVAPWVAAEPIKATLSVADSVLGTNTFELRPDGTFVSKSILTMGPTSSTALSGKFEGGMLESYTSKRSGTSGTATIDYSTGQAKVDAPNLKKTFDFKIDTKAVFTDFHPQVTASLLGSYSGPGIKPVRMFFPEGPAFIDGTLEQLPGKTILKGTQSVELNHHLLKFRGLEVDLYSTKEGLLVAEYVASQKFKIVVDGYEKVLIDPVEQYKELSQPTFKVKRLEGLKMKTRDGVTLVADVAIPDADGKYPVILERTPYGRKPTALTSDFYVKRGYAVVVQDCRGREDSEGEWDPFVHEREDGADTIAWIASQPWSNGKVGMIGGSYGGYVQWAAAAELPPALKCIIPQVSPPDAFNNLPYDQGTFFLLPNLWWGNLVKEKQTHLELAAKPIPGVKNLLTLPLSKLDELVLGAKVPFWQKWLERDTMTKWKGFDHLGDLAKIKIPSLHISGWWDGDEAGTMLHWQIRRKAGMNDKQWLIYGPWTHAFNTATKVADVDYGPTAILELDSVYLRFFDTYLKAMNVGWEKQPKVKAFLAGANEWMDLSDWPDEKRMKPSKVFLSESGKLVPSSSKSKGQTRYEYDPAKVILDPRYVGTDPSKETLILEDGGRKDYVVFRTEQLAKPLTIVAPMNLEFYFKSSARDTDFFVLAFDEDEKGVRHAISQYGKYNASYREGFTKRILMKPGQVYKANIRIWDTAYQFKKGHRLGILVTSQIFPVAARNLNTGEPIANATKMVTAHQTILHDPKHPGSLSFWVPR